MVNLGLVLSRFSHDLLVTYSRISMLPIAGFPSSVPFASRVSGSRLASIPKISRVVPSRFTSTPSSS